MHAQRRVEIEVLSLKKKIAYLIQVTFLTEKPINTIEELYKVITVGEIDVGVERESSTEKMVILKTF